MTVFIVIAWALIGAGAALAIGMVIAPAFGFPQMEGSSAIFAVLIAAPVGALLGGVGGLKLSRKYAADPEKQKKVAIGSWLALAALAIGTPFSGPNDYLSNGSASKIGYEIRLPAGVPAPAKLADISVELRSDKETRKAEMYEGLWRQKDGDRAVIRGYVEFYRVTPNRTIALRIADGPTHLFKLTIPARPKSSPGFYEDWFPVTQIDDNVAGQAPRAPRPDEGSDIRHFVTIGY